MVRSVVIDMARGAYRFLAGHNLPRMAIYDVTVTLRAGMPTWDGEPGPECRPIKRIGVAGESARVSLLTVGSHTGTHLDAPAHFIAGGATVEELPLDALVGRCRVVE